MTDHRILMIEYDASAAQRKLTAEQWEEQARRIDALPGLRWKYWLRDDATDRRGGVYLFASNDAARGASEILTGSLADAGAANVVSRVFAVDGELSAITRGLLTR